MNEIADTFKQQKNTFKGSLQYRGGSRESCERFQMKWSTADKDNGDPWFADEKTRHFRKFLKYDMHTFPSHVCRSYVGEEAA